MEIGATTIRALLMETEGRKPTVRQVRAIENMVENGRKTKAEALREAGYSEAIVRHPDRVFGSPTVRYFLEKYRLDEGGAVVSIKRNLNAKAPVNFVFPPFRENERDIAILEGNVGAKFGEQMTDQEIRDYLKEGGITVSKVVHGDMARRVYGYADNPKAQLSAADMVLKIFGAYAPDRVVGKHTLTVGVMSMSELRERMRGAGVSVIQKTPIIINE